MKIQLTRGCPKARSLDHCYSWYISQISLVSLTPTPRSDCVYDCLVYRSVRGVEDQRRLQQDLDALSLWGDCWGMRFNASKCNIIHMGNVKSQFFYQLNNQILQSVSNAVYLGVTLTYDLSWSQHVATIVSKAHQRLGFIRRNLRGSPYKCRETAFIALTRSQLEYCSSIWDPILNKDSDSIEKVQRKAARWARGQYGSISVTQLLKDLKWRPLADRRRDHRIILLYKILHGSVNIPPRTVDIRKSKRTPRGVSNPDKLERPRATRKSYPLWNSTVFRTIPEWNQLPASIHSRGRLYYLIQESARVRVALRAAASTHSLARCLLWGFANQRARQDKTRHGGMVSRGRWDMRWWWFSLTDILIHIIPCNTYIRAHTWVRGGYPSCTDTLSFSISGPLNLQDLNVFFCIIYFNTWLR